MGSAREGVPMSTDTINLWFSSGKPLTTVAVARLWEREQLDLEMPVGEVIPEFGVHGKGEIRIRHLLNHTAGFRAADRIVELPAWEETIRLICEVPIELDWVPGARAGYQLFSSWFVLGEIVRRLDPRRRPIDQFVAEEIFAPVAMQDCWMGLPQLQFERYKERLGLMHFLSQGKLRPHPVWNDPVVAAAVRPGGNVRGPIRMLGRFYEALLGFRPVARGHAGANENGESLWRRETRAMFTRPSRGALYDETFRHVMDWGLGFGVNSNRFGRGTVPYGFGPHASDDVFGHGGSQSSCGYADPAHGLVVAWVCNGMIGEPAHQERAGRINAAIYADLGLA
jgi:CubicO group peptidase (beta-lactamase class C family)